MFNLSKYYICLAFKVENIVFLISQAHMMNICSSAYHWNQTSKATVYVTLKIGRFCTFLKSHFITSLYSLVAKETTAKAFMMNSYSAKQMEQ